MPKLQIPEEIKLIFLTFHFVDNAQVTRYTSVHSFHFLQSLGVFDNFKVSGHSQLFIMPLSFYDFGKFSN